MWGHVPFDIRRVFTVSARVGDIRRDHADKKCTQLPIYVSGQIHVSCDNGLHGSARLKEVQARYSSIDEVQSISFPIFNEINHHGILRVFELTSLPFKLVRIFSVGADAGGERGHHAHRECSQLLVCITGEITVSCEDGKSHAQYELSPATDALLIPPGIWSKQYYRVAQSSLLVLCDREFNENEYLRDYSEYISWKETS